MTGPVHKELTESQVLASLLTWAENNGMDLNDLEKPLVTPEQDLIIPEPPAILDPGPPIVLEPKRLSPHFLADEFTCNHCGAHPPNGVPQRLLDILEALRAHFGKRAVNINSGYRCSHWNAAVGGATNSEHLKGTAADVFINGISPRDVYNWLNENYTGIGLGYYDTFTHVDVRGYDARW